MTLSVQQAAEELGLSTSSVYALCAAQKLRHLRIGPRGGAIRIPRDALDEYRAACSVGGEGVPAPRAAPAVTPPPRLRHVRLKP